MAVKERVGSGTGKDMCRARPEPYESEWTRDKESGLGEGTSWMWMK